MSFTTEARAAAEELWEKSKKHAFIQEIQDGTLSPAVFRYYLLQDRYYLEQFAKIHQKAAELATLEEEKQLFLAGVTGLEEAEIAVREGFFKELGISEEEIAAVPIAPTAYHYTTHMYSELLSGSTARTAAALLPCYWLYQEIGEYLIESGSSHPLYQRWIETYDSEGYKEAVTRQRELTDRLAQSATAKERQAMLQGFLVSSYQEWKFWEMAYVQEKWEDSSCIHIS
ncbi:thiaminase II [Candidatus Enterococcus clewellii]|uniref:Aminopyrimidine aminohydrolase n=1 Tax=Candidatus Enterococcus clewellii TaxID=1834193 RepID=A0A242K716_9ENTE|nr:thiaminase II [Enterococcus sp. 9E7_DIV0242]OTP16111.1 thiaminase II [Enterococcus sp. 9E7_DIV0242]